MNCREFVDFLMAYLDGTLEASEREVFEVHMVDCPGCETYLETYRETIRLGKACFCGCSDDLPEPRSFGQARLRCPLRKQEPCRWVRRDAPSGASAASSILIKGYGADAAQRGTPRSSRQ